jgi:phage/plasmid-associated DNA primase
MEERFVPVPQEEYDELEIEPLRNILNRLNFSVMALKDEIDHPDYERAKAFYQAEQRKCNKALVAKNKAARREAGEPDPPDIVIGMKAIDIRNQVLPKE